MNQSDGSAGPVGRRGISGRFCWGRGVLLRREPLRIVLFEGGMRSRRVGRPWIGSRSMLVLGTGLARALRSMRVPGRRCIADAQGRLARFPMPHSCNQFRELNSLLAALGRVGQALDSRGSFRIGLRRGYTHRFFSRPSPSLDGVLEQSPVGVAEVVTDVPLVSVQSLPQRRISNVLLILISCPGAHALRDNPLQAGGITRPSCSPKRCRSWREADRSWFPRRASAQAA